MRCHHWLSVSYKLISAIDRSQLRIMEWHPSLTARQTVNVLVLTHIALPSPDDTKKENHVQAYAPWGALSLNQRDSLTSKLDGYPAGWDSPFRGQSLYVTIFQKLIFDSGWRIDEVRNAWLSMALFCPNKKVAKSCQCREGLHALPKTMFDKFCKAYKRR